MLTEESAIYLLDHLLVHEWSGLHVSFRKARFLHNVNQAAEKGKMKVVDWWLTKYLPLDDHTVTYIMENAIYWDRIHVLNWLERKGVLPEPYGFFVECRHASTAHWLEEREFKLSIDVEVEIERNNLDFMTRVSQNKEFYIIRDLERGIQIAASINSVEMAELLAGSFEDVEWDLPTTMNPNVHLKMVEWIDEQFDEGHLWHDEDDNDRSYYSNVYSEDEESDEYSDDDKCSDGSDCYCATYESDNDDEIDKDAAHRNWVNCTMLTAVESGQLDVVKYLFNHCLFDPSCELIFLAAEKGHMKLLQWLHTMEPACSRAAIGYAAKGGHFKIMQWLQEQETSSDQLHKGQSTRRWHHLHGLMCSIDEAAEYGSLELIQWLHSHRPHECTTIAMDRAASGGHLAIVQWLHKNRGEGCTVNALIDAASNGHIRMVQWLLENRKECHTANPSAIDSASLYGQLVIVKWLHDNRSDGCTVEAVNGAAEAGHFEIVKFLLQNRHEGFTKAAVEGAAKNGHLQIIKCLVMFGSTGRQAATKLGKQFKEAINLAAASGHVHIVKFLHDHCRLRCTKAAVKVARDSKHFAVLEWIMQHDPDFADCWYGLPKDNTKPSKREKLGYLKSSNSRISSWDTNRWY